MDHFLLISGPGGAGKSTFISMLSSARLPPDLQRLLPTGAVSWSSFASVQSKSRLRALVAAKEVILEYDIAACARRQEPYAADPVLACLQSATRVTVVDIRPPPGRLINQLWSREAKANAQRSRLQSIWRACGVRYALRSREKQRQSRFPSKITLYRQEGWLEACYLKWDAFLCASLAAHDDFALIRIEPETTSAGLPLFRMITCERRQSGLANKR